MEPVFITIYVKKKVWHKCCIHRGSFFSYIGNQSRHANDDAVNGNHMFAGRVRADLHLDDYVTSENKFQTLNINSFNEEIQMWTGDDECFSECNRATLKMDGYALSIFTKLMMHSGSYRKNFIGNYRQYLQSRPKLSLSKETLHIIVNLLPVKQDIVDYKWNERVTNIVMERRELENAMYWLSTLGGAFSALGDEFQHCAVMAGRISIGQLWLALRLGDILTVARCKLFLALSLMQQGRLPAARRLVQEQYTLAKTASEVDPRLGRMCLGVWAKLRYAYQIRHHTQKLKSR